MDRELYDLAKLANEDVLPSVLRPELAAKSSPADIDVTNPDKLSGNFIAHIGSTEVAFNKGIRAHLEANPKCMGDVILDPSTYCKMGLGVRAGLKCTECSFCFNRVKFYEEVESDRPKRGNKAVKLNVQFQVALTKEPVGNTAIRNILAMLDIDPPTVHAMQEMANKVGQVFTELNENQLALNRSIVSTVVRIRKGDGDVESGPAPIVVAADGGYNNPPKGRTFYQPGTQSWCPMFSMEEGLEIPVAFATRSKLCSCPEAKVGVHLKSCTKTFPTHVAMGNSEKEMGKDCAQQIDGKELTVGTVIADGDGHLVSGVQEAITDRVVERQNCSRHLTKSISRNIGNGSLACMPGPTQALKKKQKYTLAKFVAKRCAWEYREAHRRYGKNLNRLIVKC